MDDLMEIEMDDLRVSEGLTKSLTSITSPNLVY